MYHLYNVIDKFQLLTFLLKLIMIDLFLLVERTCTLMFCFHQRMNLKEWKKKDKESKKWDDLDWGKKNKKWKKNCE